MKRATAAPIAALVAGVAVLALGSASGFAQSRAQSRNGTHTGRYTAEQAEAGSALYAIHCAMCHGNRMQAVGEVPALTGRFVANWVGRPVGDLFGYVAQAMPQHAPGSLSPDQTAKLVALILQANGVPAGRTALPVDESALARIAFDPPGAGR
ncbi:MAG: c-type cytochrome [Alteraurantiacibacter sp.]